MSVYAPLVSIIIPAYNATDYLSEALNSALSQSYRNIEILIVNDGSTDDGATERLSLLFQEKYPEKIRYFHKENGGCASALNYGMREMKGDYFSWLSHDDLYLPDKVAALLQLLDRFDIDPNKTVLGCNDLVMGSNKKVKPNMFNNTIGLITPKNAFDETLNVKTIDGCGLLIPRQIIDAVGEFRVDYKHLLDREYWMRIAWRGFSFYYADKPLVVSRVHNRQITMKSQELLYNEECKLIDEYVPLVSNNAQLDYLRSLCYFAYKRKHYIQGKMIVEVINKLGGLNITTKYTIIKYSVRGILRKWVRNLYKSVIRR